MKELARRLYEDIQLTQRRSERARVSATRARIRKLAEIGIQSGCLASCDWPDVTL